MEGMVMIAMNEFGHKIKSVTRKEFFVVGVAHECIKIPGNKGAQWAKIAKNQAEKELERV